MSPLALIWWLSLVLAGAALATTFALVLARLLTTRSALRAAALRRALVRQWLGPETGSTEPLDRFSRRLVADTVIDLIRLVRGEERRAFVTRAETLGVDTYLGRQLRRGAARERLLAAQALAAFGSEASVAALRAALADRSRKVRLAAALSLSESGNSGDVRELVSSLHLGSREGSALAVTLLQRISAEKVGDVVALIVSPGTHPSVRLAAIEALVARGDYSVVPTLADLALAADDNSVELPRYLRALGILAHPAGRRAVIDGLDRGSSAVRAAAAEAAGRIGLAEVAGRLAVLLDDEEWWVRFRAAEALLRLGGGGVDRLRDVARDGPPRARTAATAMLAEYAVA